MTAWQAIKNGGLEVAYDAPDSVRAVIAALGRTEDLRFSPDNRRLAVAGFNRNCIAIFDLDVSADRVVLSRAVELRSAHLKRPHGLNFLDDETLIVANRDGGVCIFSLPADGGQGGTQELAPIQVASVDGAHHLASPGSVWADRATGEVMVCNNASSCVTRHRVDRGAGWTIHDSEVLLRKWLDLPDGIAVSRDRRWIAVSNHNSHNVLLFENSGGLGPDSDPAGILRGAHYPHGLRFSADDRFLILADAAAPYVHAYARDRDGWRGVRNPVASFRIMEDTLFQRGRNNPQEGGPKGLDLDAGAKVLAVTSECQPLAFFRLPVILEAAEVGVRSTAFEPIAADRRDGVDPRRDPRLLAHYRRERQAMQMHYELESMERERLAWGRLERSLLKARTKLARMKGSLSWRITKPMRRIASLFRHTG